MNFRVFKYFSSIGITGTILKVPALLVVLLTYALAVLGILGIAAFIYGLT